VSVRCPRSAPTIFNGEQNLCKISTISSENVYIDVNKNHKDYFTSYYFDHEPEILPGRRTVHYIFKFRVGSEEYDYIELSLPKGSKLSFHGNSGRNIDWYIGPNRGGFYSNIYGAYYKFIWEKNVYVDNYTAESSGTHWIIADNMGSWGTSGTFDIIVDYANYDVTKSIANCTGFVQCSFPTLNMSTAYVVTELNDPTITDNTKDFKCYIHDEGNPRPGLITGLVAVGLTVLFVLFCILAVSKVFENKADKVRAEKAPATSTATATPSTPVDPEIAAPVTPGSDPEYNPNPNASPYPPNETAGPTSSYATAFGTDMPPTAPPAYPGADPSAPVDPSLAQQPPAYAVEPVGPAEPAAPVAPVEASAPAAPAPEETSASETTSSASSDSGSASDA